MTTFKEHLQETAKIQEELFEEVLTEGMNFSKLDSGRDAYYESLLGYGMYKKPNKTLAMIKNGKPTKPLQKELDMMKEYGTLATRIAEDLNSFTPVWNEFSKLMDKSSKSEWKAICTEWIPKLDAATSSIFIRDASTWESLDYMWIRGSIQGDEAKKFMKRYSTTKGKFYHLGKAIGTGYANTNYEGIRKAALSGKFDWNAELSMAQYAECYDWQSIMFSVETIKKTQLRLEALFKEGKGNW